MSIRRCFLTERLSRRRRILKRRSAHPKRINLVDYTFFSPHTFLLSFRARQNLPEGLKSPSQSPESTNLVYIIYLTFEVQNLQNALLSTLFVITFNQIISGHFYTRKCENSTVFTKFSTMTSVSLFCQFSFDRIVFASFLTIQLSFCLHNIRLLLPTWPKCEKPADCIGKLGLFPAFALSCFPVIHSHSFQNRSTRVPTVAAETSS